MAGTEWIVQRGEQQFPVPDVATLKQWVTTGNITPGDRIWHPVSGAWTSAAQVPEIADLWVRPTPAMTAAANSAVATPAALISSAAVSGVGLRAVGYIVDAMPSAILSLIMIIPIIGQFFGGILVGSYWLLRDIKGASLGKMLVGTRVVAVGGGEASTNARILRNLPLCIGPFLFAIPILGYAIGGAVTSLSFLIEIIMVLTQGSRLGDRFAGTMVVKK
jgi:uncharacterized RDD family membrane protein YckC